jgi:putative hemolysin
MLSHSPKFQTRLAASESDIKAAQRLRYNVFVAELGGDGDLVDHDARLERDVFDPHYDHLLLEDTERTENDSVVGVYRLLRGDQLNKAGRFYVEDEYDLSVLKSSGRPIMELGRSCLHEDYRGGTAMHALWNGLASYVLENGIEVMFGVASFHGTDVSKLAQPLSFLHHRHLAPVDLRVRALPEHFQTMNLLPETKVDRLAALRATPALIKAYLRLGGFVGEGAFVDKPFNTTDVCLVMDTARMSEKHRDIYVKARK